MDEYIWGKSIKEKLVSAFAMGIRTHKKPHDILIDALNTIDEEPAADVAPVRHGRWEIIEDDILSDTWIKCSACGNEHETAYEQNLSCYPYCPNCGAKMDLED